MPVTKSGQKVMKSMKEQYGAKKGEEVFYASINAGKPGSEKWHGKSKKGGGPAHIGNFGGMNPKPKPL